MMKIANDMSACLRVFRSRFVLPLLVALSGFVAQPVLAMPIDKTATVNVINLCSDTGTSCASLGPSGDQFFQAEVNKIWAQAGIQINFNYLGSLNSTFYSNINDSASNSFANLNALVGGPSTSNIFMFLVHSVVGAYGEAWLGYGGLVIAMDTVMAYNSGQGRLDTIAHELGHNFGLPHFDVSNYLMASGGIRSTPSSLSNIAPDGLGLDTLSASEIAIARSSSLLQDLSVPEPGTLLLVLPFLAIIARRRTV